MNGVSPLTGSREVRREERYVLRREVHKLCIACVGGPGKEWEDDIVCGESWTYGYASILQTHMSIRTHPVPLLSREAYFMTEPVYATLCSI